MDDMRVFQPSEAEKEMVLRHRGVLSKMKDGRNTPDRKLDNLTFIQDYYSNEDARNSYLRPKRNDDEVRVVGTTTEKRVESVVNELVGSNTQVDVQAFDQNDVEVRGLGKAMEDAILRTNPLENDRNVLMDAAFELISQRAVWLEETLETRRIGNTTRTMCRKRMRSALEVLVGDPTMPFYLLQEQPYVATYDRQTIQSLRPLWGDRPNFKYVVPGQDLSTDVYGTDITFRIGVLQQDECEVVHFMSVPDNEHQVYINGVPMLPVGEKLPFQYPFPRYPLAVAVPKMMGHHYFYGRPMTASLKYLQALSDESVRNVIRKFRQAISPPRATPSNERIYTRDMYDAGTISYGVNVDSLRKLIDHDGVTNAEMGFLSLIKGMQEEASARSDSSIGVTPDKRQTATAALEQKNAAAKMLLQAVVAWEWLIAQAAENRCYNIIESFSRADSKVKDPATGKFVEQFRRFTLKGRPLDNGRSGDRIVQFVGEDLSEEGHRRIADWEEEQAKAGKPAKLSVINIKRLKDMSLNWFFTTTSRPKDNDDLHKAMFQDKLSQAMQVTQSVGRQLDAERVVAEFENTWRADDWFLEEQPGMAGNPGMPPGGGGRGTAFTLTFYIDASF
jgi:hypothetical protein